MRSRLTYPALIGLVAAVFFVPYLGGVPLFDWDEVNFAECAREMLMTGDYLRVYIGYEPFWEKPPFFFWLQAGAMHLFGIGEFAARLPNAVCGVVTLIVLYRAGTRLYDERFGLLWALAYFGSILPNFYFRSGIIDPWFNLFIFLGLYHVVLFHWKRDDYAHVAQRLPHGEWHYLLVGGFWVGMGVLTKGPVALLIVGLCMAVYWALVRFRWYISVLQAVVFVLASLVVTGIWFGIETYNNGPWFVQTFLVYQYRLFSTPDAGHAGFPGYHFVVLLLGCFPASVFCLRAFGPQLQQHLYQRNFKTWMLILFWVVLILFTIVKSKIVHYSSMCYFPLTFLSALSVHQVLEGKERLAGWVKGTLLVICGLLGAVLVAVPLLSRHIGWVKSLLVNDPFAQANLDAQVVWYGWEGVAGAVLLLGTLLGVAWLARPERAWQGAATLFGSTAVAVLLVMYLYFPKIEPYSQGAAIEFFSGLEGKDCYTYTSGYRSYAQYFYPKTKPDTRPNPPSDAPDGAWEKRLFYGDIDKDVYVAGKIYDQPRLDSVKTLKKLYAKNGFVFYMRPKGH
jgi:4-amino-4-deoxy-L-arabinose transferase-like glycosyltransferase